MNVQCSGVSRSFAKETRVLKMRSTVAGIRSWQRPTESNHQSLSSYNDMRSCWRTQCQPLYSLHLNQIGKLKKLSVASWADWKKKKKKKRLFWSVGFSYSVQQWTISQLDCDIQWKVDFIRQPVVTSSVAELRSSKALLKVKPAAEKDHGQSLVISCQSGPL